MADGEKKRRRGPLKPSDAKSVLVRADGTPPTALVVDDEAGMRDMLRTTLTVEGWTVEEVATGEEAIEAWKRTTPDVVLLDQNLRTMSGLECASRLRVLSDETRIILFSGYLDAEASKEARRLRLLPMPKTDQPRLLELLTVLAEQVGGTPSALG
ncbi:MAG: two-component system, OmpR family, response regulator [Actinomycetota bacterium]|jgi:CheY-like chemotaxis protein|nr:two-component system, OmpR family, response regulator [Actinomycetota bacterium]